MIEIDRLERGDHAAQVAATRFVFQPVFELAGRDLRPYALEALCRTFAGLRLAEPEQFFAAARAQGLEAQVDRVCLAAALRAAAGLGAPPVAVNVHATTLDEPDFLHFLGATAERLGIPLDRITLEILEHSGGSADRQARLQLASLRRRGLQIALDDVGADSNYLPRLFAYRPDLVKVDRELVRSCEREPRRAIALGSIVDLATKFSARVVAEGIETAGELATVRALGIELVQGYLCGGPLSAGDLQASELLPAPLAAAIS
jgi:EAL domain-containing protein (putative c-di-GMP-specific phosphodiesterase class I)